MALVLFDTNIFIDMLNGVHQAAIELRKVESRGQTRQVDKIDSRKVGVKPGKWTRLTRA
ncbi:MAG: hypothetical protein V4582_19000 [Pseudomonadota bacterium]